MCYNRFQDFSLQWRHNGCDGVSDHQPYDCLLNPLFRRRWKKPSKLHVTGLCEGNSPVWRVTGEFPVQRASDAENVSIWRRYHIGTDLDLCVIFVLIRMYYNTAARNPMVYTQTYIHIYSYIQNCLRRTDFRVAMSNRCRPNDLYYLAYGMKCVFIYTYGWSGFCYSHHLMQAITLCKFIHSVNQHEICICGNRWWWPSLYRGLF